MPDHCPQDVGELLRQLLAAETLDLDYVVRRYLDRDARLVYEFHTARTARLTAEGEEVPA